MEKFSKKRAVIAALIFSALGSTGDVSATNALPPTKIAEQISFVRQFTDEHSEAMRNSDSLLEVVPQKHDDEMAWKKTWNNQTNFCDSFGDFWG